MSTLEHELRKLRTTLSIAIENLTRQLKPTEPASKPLELLSSGAIQLYSIGVVALLYFLGWMFLYYYLLSFGIDIFALDIPFHYFFVYAFATIKFSSIKWPWIVALCVLLAPVIIVVAHILIGRSKVTGNQFFLVIGTVLLAALVGAVFFLAHAGAQRTADWDYKKIRYAPAFSYEFRFRPNISLESSPRLAGLQSIQLDRSGSTKAIPIIETKDRYFVLIQAVLPPPADSRTRTIARVVEINRDDVLFATIVTSDERLTCDEAQDLGIHLKACN